VLAGEENTRKQQILRIDREGIVPDTSSVKTELLGALKTLRKQVDALLISDYHYFTVKEDLYRKIQPLYQRSDTPLTLDSRFRLLCFPETTVSTPNEPEMEHALQRETRDGHDWLKETGRKLLKQTGARAVLLTRGSKGMVLYERGRPMFSIPIRGPADIVDVTGAGDTVISVLTLALASGASYREAASLANYAGGVVVMKKGTAAVSSEELRNAVISL
jgi:rfaE bifunctional protein kinase chain/domain